VLKSAAERRWIASALSALLGVSGVANAGDGTIEINQAAALAGAVTPGDTPGFPVTISAPGAFRLTGNLLVSSASTAISIEAQNVSLDLGGFSVAGPNSCSGYPTNTCTTSGGNAGIVASGSAHQVRVENGVVRSFNGRGVWLQGASSTAENLRVLVNGGDGIDLGGAGRVIRCVSLANFGHGISVLNDGFVEASEARANQVIGIVANDHGTVVRSIALSNGGRGISAGDGGRIAGNEARVNGSYGFVALGDAGLLLNNVSYQNQVGYLVGGWLTSQNLADGNTTNNNVGGVSLGDNLCAGVLC
jgi:hypothetical protein